MTSSPTVPGCIISCHMAHLLADSLALCHLCAVSSERKRARAHKQTHRYIFWWQLRLSITFLVKLSTAGGDSFLIFFFYPPTPTCIHIHNPPTFGCLAYFPVRVSLMVLMSRISTSYKTVTCQSFLHDENTSVTNNCHWYSVHQPEIRLKVRRCVIYQCVIECFHHFGRAAWGTAALIN